MSFSFVDIDGVLDGDPNWGKNMAAVPFSPSVLILDLNCMKALKKIIEKMDAKI